MPTARDVADAPAVPPRGGSVPAPGPAVPGPDVSLDNGLDNENGDGESVDGGGDVGSDEGDADAVEHLRPNGETRTSTRPADPYANLDNAFGRYVSDSPPPTANGNRKEDEDLLF